MLDRDNLLFQLHHGQPIELYWDGWRTNTALLDRNGWKFSADERRDEYRAAHIITLAATSPDGRFAIRGNKIYGIQELFYRDKPQNIGWERWPNEAPWQMELFSCKEVFREITPMEFSSWESMKAVDIMEATYAKRHRRLDEFKFFKQTGTQHEKQIFIPPDTVDDLLNKILAIQYPEQQKIKNGLFMPDAKPIIQAQVFSLAV